MTLGKSTPKIDGMEKISGQAVFVDDMTRPGMLHAAFLRSPHAHARILSIDISKAEAMEGVHAVMIGKDLPVNYGVIPVAQDETALAMDKVRFIGEEVAVVAAVDRATAIAATKEIKVKYEVLESVLTIEDALDPDKPLPMRVAEKRPTSFEGSSKNTVIQKAALKKPMSFWKTTTSTPALPTFPWKPKVRSPRSTKRAKSPSTHRLKFPTTSSVHWLESSNFPPSGFASSSPMWVRATVENQTPSPMRFVPRRSLSRQAGQSNAF